MRLKRLVFAMVAPIVIGGYYAHARYSDDYGDGYYTTYPPPAAQVEVAGPAPYAGAVSIDGYWGWAVNATSGTAATRRIRAPDTSGSVITGPATAAAGACTPATGAACANVSQTTIRPPASEILTQP